MRTEIVKIVNALHKCNHNVAYKYAEKLKENYHKIDWKDQDRLFIKRILNIFYDDDPEFKSQEAVMDNQKTKKETQTWTTPAIKIFTNISKRK